MAVGCPARMSDLSSSDKPPLVEERGLFRETALQRRGRFRSDAPTVDVPRPHLGATALGLGSLTAMLVCGLWIVPLSRHSHWRGELRCARTKHHSCEVVVRIDAGTWRNRDESRRPWFVTDRRVRISLEPATELEDGVLRFHAPHTKELQAGFGTMVVPLRPSPLFVIPSDRVTSASTVRSK
mgnify:CR=1 FL=1